MRSEAYKNVVNYDADIPEEMKLQIVELRLDPDKLKGGMHDKADKDNESDETIIYDASEFDDTNKGIEKPDNKQTDGGAKTPKGQLRTQTYGMKKRKPTSKITFTCIDCGAKRKSKQDINRTIGKNIVQLNALTVTKCFQHLIPYNDTDT